MHGEARAAFLAEGKLFLLHANGDVSQVESHFVQEIESRAERTRERHGWKAQSTGWNVTASSRGAPPGLLAGLGGMQDGPHRTHVQFTALAPSEPGKWLYALAVGDVGGIFEYEEADQSERRVIHRVGLRVSHLARNPVDGTYALTLANPDGTAHLATLDPRGRGIRERTEGDCLDEAPAWDPSGTALIFQSAGVARSSHGALAGHSPYAVQRLDLASGDMTCLWEDPAFDLLLPRLAPDGSLYCLRRPYEPVRRTPVWQPALDAVLFPFRLAVAFIGFLNVFSLIFGKKPLLSAGGPEQQGPDLRWLYLHGRMVQVKREQLAQGSALVPRSWELVRRSPEGRVSTIARNVLHFDLAPDGSVLHTDGHQISRLSPDGTSTPHTRAKYLESVRAAPTIPA